MTQNIKNDDERGKFERTISVPLRAEEFNKILSISKENDVSKAHVIRRAIDMFFKTDIGIIEE